MSVTLSDEKTELIKHIAECQGFSDCEIKVSAGSMKGDGYLGIINTIRVQNGHKPTKELNLIIKSASSGELRAQVPVRKAYEREIYMYNTVFPLFRRFAEETGISTKFAETAKCYGTLLTDNQECLILENLKEDAFKLWNRKLPMNADHVSLVFVTYAKFHGTCLALKKLQPEKYNELSGNLRHIFEEDGDGEKIHAKKFAESSKQLFEIAFKAVEGNERAVAALTKFAQNSTNFFMIDLKQKNKYSCVLHGDCWCNNMLFRYMDLSCPSKPTEVCLLDWQISNIGSPVCDLSYFFYACSSKEVLYDLKKHLKIYHATVSKTIKEAGLEPDEILTYEELENQWKIYSKFGLFMAIFVIRIMLSEVEEAPDLNELAKEGKDLIGMIATTKSIHAEAANKRIADVIEFMIGNDYL